MVWRFDITTEKNLAYALCDELDTLLESQSGYDDLVMSIFEMDQDPSTCRLQGIVEQAPKETDLREAIAPIAAGLGVKDVGITIEKVPDVDWLAENWKAFPPLEIAGFYIYGSHITDPKIGSNIPLKIDASTAFGTGNHGTTEGCLQALQDLKAKGLQPQNPLDLGTGTGILAMGISRLFDVPVLATDVDPEAIEKTIFNAKENDLETQIRPLVAEGFQNTIFQEKKPFDLIVANILAGPLVEMAFDVKNCLSKGGHLILSGILLSQVPMILEAYEDTRLKLIHKREIGDWATLLFYDEE